MTADFTSSLYRQITRWLARPLGFGRTVNTYACDGSSFCLVTEYADLQRLYRHELTSRKVASRLLTVHA